MSDAAAPAERARPWLSRKPLWWTLLALSVVAAVWATAWWWRSKEHLRYITARVTQGDIERSINMTGALNPVVTVQVGSYVSGNIKSWTCDYNTVVKVGQSCARIDPLPFQVVVDEDEADVRTAVSQLAKDKAAAANAEVIYARDSKLGEEGIVSQETLDAEKSTVAQEKAQIGLDEATIAARKAALQAAQVNLSYTNIVSPVDGMVITRYIDVGQTVVTSLQSSTLFLIGKDMKRMQVDTNVSEADIGDVHEAQKAYFTVQAFPTRTFEATVRQIRRGPITVQNVVTYDVVLDVDNSDLALFPGMTADAHIITAERGNVLRVPLPATRFVPEGLTRTARPRGTQATGAAPERRNGTSPEAHRPRSRQPLTRLWVLRDGKLTPIRVRIGLDDGTLVEVSGDDLKPGDEVVVNAVRPNAPRGPVSSPAERAPGSTAGGGGGGGRGNGFRL